MISRRTDETIRRLAAAGPAVIWAIVATFGLFGLFELIGWQSGDRAAYGKEGGFVIPNPAASIQALTAVNDQLIYAGTFGAGIYRSDNRGDQWVAVTACSRLSMRGSRR